MKIKKIIRSVLILILLLSSYNYFYAQKHGNNDTTFFEPGKIKSITYYDGLYISFYQNGHKHEVRTYKKGKTDGRLISYDENEKLSHVVYYKNNKLEGNETYFYENGKPSSEVFYEKGNRDGMAITYYENGNIKTKGQYKNDKMFGKRLYYDENEKPFNGNFIIYSKNGLIERECKCINGKPEGELKVYSNGKLIMLANFKDGNPDGECNYYSFNQKLTSTEFYKNGVISNYYSPDTKPIKNTDIIDLPDKKIIF